MHRFYACTVDFCDFVKQLPGTKCSKAALSAAIQFFRKALRKPMVAAVAVFLVALALRLLWIPIQPTELLWGDAESYDREAQGVVAGTWPDARPVGYPLFLAGIYATLGRNMMTVCVLQAILGAMTCVFMYLTSERLFHSQRVAIFGGMASAVWIPWIRYSSLIVTETLFIFLLALSMFCVIRGMELRRPRYYMFAGLCLGAVSLVRATAMLMPLAWLFAFIWFFKSLRQSVKTILWVVLPMLLVLSPLIVSNYQASKQFFPANQGGGVAFWRGATKKQTLLDPVGPPWESAHLEVTGGQSMWTPEGDARLKSAAFQIVQQDPLAYVDKLFNRWVLFWLYAPGGWALTGVLGGMVRYGYWSLLLALACVGYVAASQPGLRNVVGGAMLYLSMVQAAVNFNNRYRLPVEGYVLILAVGGAGWLLARLLPRLQQKR